MTNISINQALDIWDDLRDAKEGVNGYGGNVAEIYAYRLLPYMIQPHAPQGSISCVDNDISYKNAAEALVELIVIFEEKYEVAIKIENLSPKDWLDEIGSDFTHRVHVKIL